MALWFLVQCWCPAGWRWLQHSEPGQHLPGQHQHPCSVTLLIYRDAKAVTEAQQGKKKPGRNQLYRTKRTIMVFTMLVLALKGCYLAQNIVF